MTPFILSSARVQSSRKAATQFQEVYFAEKTKEEIFFIDIFLVGVWGGQRVRMRSAWLKPQLYGLDVVLNMQEMVYCCVANKCKLLP